MAVSCEAKCAKSILISFNLIFWLAGCSLLVIGVCIFIEPARAHLFHLVTSQNLEKEMIYWFAYFLLALSGTILLIGFFGCCGALQESRCMLVSYFICLFLLLFIETGIAVVTYIYRETFLDGLDERLSAQLIHNYGQHDAFSQSVNFVQYKYKCCGILGDDDYSLTQWRNDSLTSNVARNVPMTCCMIAEPTDPLVYNAGSPISVVSRVFHGTIEEPWQHPQAKDELSCQALDAESNSRGRYKDGCINYIHDWFKRESSVIVTVSLGIATLQVFGMIFSIYLCRSLGVEI